MLVVLPADHTIGPSRAFVRAIEQAARLVQAEPGRIATFGIRPSYPAESFGYIQRGSRLCRGRAGASRFHVERFHEKPRVEVARDYLATGGFYWNSGILCFLAAPSWPNWRTSVRPCTAACKRSPAASARPIIAAVLERRICRAERISIDRAVMEHADMWWCRGPVRVGRLGKLAGAGATAGQDAHGNTVIGRHVGVRTEGTIVHTCADHLIATVGLRDCLIVHTPDATLVANKHDEEAIRQVVELLREKGWLGYL